MKVCCDLKKWKKAITIGVCVAVAIAVIGVIKLVIIEQLCEND